MELARSNRETSNQLFETLAEWNAYLSTVSSKARRAFVYRLKLAVRNVAKPSRVLRVTYEVPSIVERVDVGGKRVSRVASLSPGVARESGACHPLAQLISTRVCEATKLTEPD